MLSTQRAFEYKKHDSNEFGYRRIPENKMATLKLWIKILKISRDGLSNYYVFIHVSSH